MDRLKRLLLIVSFFYVSWEACYDGSKDYAGKHEDRYGIKHSTITMDQGQLENSRKSGYISFGGEMQTCARRHATFNTGKELKDFLDKAPQQVSGVEMQTITSGD